MTEKKKTSGRPKTRNESKAPVVKEVKVEEVAKEDEDKGLIVLIAIAILIIIGTVIGLLVGCQKEEKNETIDENKTDVIEVPVTDNKTNDEDEDNDVVRTTSSTTTTKYQITYILDGKKVYSANLSSGSKIKKYVPSGYEKCTYYKDSEHSENFDFSVTPTDDMKVYLVCSLKEYTVTYKDSDGSEISSETLTGTDTEGYSVDGNSKDNFLGWSKNGNSTIAYKAGATIDVNENLTLTAVYGATTVSYKTAIVKTKKKVETNETSDDQVVDEPVPEESFEDPVYVDEVVVGYTQEEVDNYSLPENPSEVGLEAPKYYVPTDGETDTSKRIVSDDTEEVGDRQVRLGDVEGHTPDWYSPAVDDNVDEKDCEFVGWTVNGETPASNYQPSTTKEDEVVANYQIPEEDQNPPQNNNNNNNNSDNNPPAEVPAEEVVTE